MASTQNYDIPLPQLGEPADIRVIDQGTEKIDNIMHGNRTMIAPGWVSTETYNTGNRVVYLGEYYKCKEDGVTGAWDDTKWDKTTVGEDIEGLGTGGASALADLDDVEITSPTDGQALLYDDSDDKWKNQNLPDVSVTKEASGNPIEITDAAAAPMVKCVTEIQGYQEGTGTPSPDNIRPITAYTEGEIEVSDTKTFNDLERGGYNNDGSKRNATNRVRTPIFLLKAGAHIVKCVSNIGKTPTIAYVTWLNDSYGSNTLISDSGWQGATVTVTLANDTYICFIIKNTDESNFNTTDITLTITEKSTTHTTTFPNAIYRGSEDCVGGTVGADKIKLTITSGIQLYGPFGTYNALLFYYELNINIATYSRATHPADNKLISNFYNAITTENENDMLDFEIRTNNNAQMVSNRIYIRDSRFETALAFNQYIANNPIEVVVKLATPTASSVTPTNLPIRTLSGYNHIESSTGDMEVEYISGNYQALVDLIQSSSHVYSTAEQVVGKWIDGTTVYERVIEYDTPFNIANDNWYTSTESYTGINILTNAWVINSDGAIYNGIIVLIQNDKLVIGNQTKTQPINNLKYVILQYTKTAQTRSLSAHVTSQKAQIEPLADKPEEVPAEEEKTVETPETEEENDER